MANPFNYRKMIITIISIAVGAAIGKWVADIVQPTGFLIFLLFILGGTVMSMRELIRKYRK